MRNRITILISPRLRNGIANLINKLTRESAVASATQVMTTRHASPVVRVHDILNNRCEHTFCRRMPPGGEGIRVIGLLFPLPVMIFQKRRSTAYRLR